MDSAGNYIINQEILMISGKHCFTFCEDISYMSSQLKTRTTQQIQNIFSHSSDLWPNIRLKTFDNMPSKNMCNTYQSPTAFGSNLGTVWINLRGYFFYILYIVVSCSVKRIFGKTQRTPGYCFSMKNFRK